MRGRQQAVRVAAREGGSGMEAAWARESGDGEGNRTCQRRRGDRAIDRKGNTADST